MHPYCLKISIQVVNRKVIATNWSLR